MIKSFGFNMERHLFIGALGGRWWSHGSNMYTECVICTDDVSEAYMVATSQIPWVEYVNSDSVMMLRNGTYSIDHPLAKRSRELYRSLGFSRTYSYDLKWADSYVVNERYKNSLKWNFIRIFKLRGDKWIRYYKIVDGQIIITGEK